MAKKRVFIQTVDEVMALREAGAYIWWACKRSAVVEPWHYSIHGDIGHSPYYEARDSAEDWLGDPLYGLFVEVDDGE